MTMRFLGIKPKYEATPTRNTMVYPCGTRKAKNNKARNIPQVEVVRLYEERTTVNEHNMGEFHTFFTQES